MRTITLTVTIMGTDDDIDAQFPAVPSSAACDQGMTSSEVAADKLAATIQPPTWSGLTVIVEPATPVRAAAPLRDRLDEMAGWVRGMVGYDRRAAVDGTQAAAWVEYVMGHTDDRPE